MVNMKLKQKAGIDIIKSKLFKQAWVTPSGKTNYISCNIKTNLLKEKLEMIGSNN